jgi:hypothetical protein
MLGQVPAKGKNTFLITHKPNIMLTSARAMHLSVSFPGGLYYANLVVSGVPVVPPTKPIAPSS